jgi:hypothetical protein
VDTVTDSTELTNGKGEAAAELDDFLATTLPRQIAAEEALHSGDVAPRMEMWSTQDPVTSFGGWGSVQKRMGGRKPYLPLGRVAILQRQRLSI